MLIGVFMALAAAGPVAAQITYNVFPAVPVNTVVQPTNSELAPVTLDVRDSTIAYVVRTLVHQAHLRVMYDMSSPLFAKRVTARVDHENVLIALSVVLKGTGLKARMASDGETVLVSPVGVGAIGSQLAVGRVDGRVTDSASGQGLSGASVRVEGVKGLSSVTSDSGNFTLRDVPAGDQVLTVRLFGYRAVERSVVVVDSQRTMVRIVLASIPTVLSGVVTTATGVQRKIEVGNDITSLNVDSIMQIAPVTSVTDLLETRVPGLTVLHSSGEPGAPSRLRLRGIGSISGNNDPIIIVDGVRMYSSQSDTRNNNLAPTAALNNYGGLGSSTNGSGSVSSKDQAQRFAAPSPIDQIDPNNIATIEVFKGPSASALYGSDAANGVIVITTKHGRAGPTHWSLDLGQGVNWIPGSWPENYFRFGANANSIGPICNWYDPTCAVIDSVRSFQALNDPAYTVFSHGSNQTINLDISGGVPVLQYSLTGSGSGQLGNLKLPGIEQQRYTTLYGAVPGWMVRPDQYTTWGVSGQLTASPAATFRITLQSSLFNSAQQTSTLQGAIPQLEGVFISGQYATYYNGTTNFLGTNPLITNEVERVTDDGVTTANTLNLSWSPRQWLPITATGGLQTIQRTDQAYIPFGVNSGGPGGGNGNLLGNISGNDTTGFYGLGRGLSHDQTVTIGTLIPVLSQRLNLALGGTFNSETVNDFSASTTQLAPGVSSPENFLTCGTGSTICATAGQDGGSTATYGWYVEPRLTVASRFFVSPGFRLDGGSGGTHASSNGGGAGGVSAFPKLDFSYVAVDRQGSHPLWGFLTSLRPRVAFGLAGTQPAPQDRLRLFNVGSGNDQAINPGGGGNLVNAGGCETTLFLNGETVNGVCLNSLGNTQLRPERSSELEGGFDATIWNGRLTLTYTKYDKTRKDAIIVIPVAPSVSQLGGTQFQIADNIGEVRNTGTELTVNAAVIESRSFSWNIGANLSNDNNLLVHLNRGQSANYGLGLVPGYPLFGEWSVPILSFADQNHDGIIEPLEVRYGDSLVYQGQPNPKYQLNLNTDVHLLGGRLGLYATFAYQNGMTQNNQGALASSSFVTLGNNPSTPLAYQAAFIGASCVITGSGSGYACRSSTNYGLTQTVNTLRFSDLSINYQLPRSVSSWFRVPRATVAVQGTNLALHTNYRGQDPDVNAFATVSSGDETVDLGQIPEPRTWWLKFTLGN